MTDMNKEDLGSRLEQGLVALHFGLFGGPGVLGVVVKLLWVLLGVIPPLLVATGSMMYRNRKLALSGLA